VFGASARKRRSKEEVRGGVKREAGGQGEFSGEFSVGLAARRDVVSQPAT
jgi:hypothetical protein